jgi:hypothetical protein
MMILLTIIAVGLLSLSAVTLRTTSQASPMIEAQANARLALMIAIGELQKQTGADTRVTAPSEIVEPGSPPIVGVWRSWEGLNHESTGPAAGRPIQPNYNLKKIVHSSSNEQGRFLTWLISTAKEGQNASDPSTLAVTTPAADGSTVALLAAGTLGSNPGQIHLKPQIMNDQSGAIAWWVSPENQKARLAQPHKPRTNDVAGLVELGQSHGVPNAGIFGLQNLASDPEEFRPDPANPKSGRKAISLKSTELLINNNPDNPQHSFHDLSTNAVGLLTNTATGGWRKDLSILTEKWDSIYSSYSGGRLPLFRYTPKAGNDATSQVPKPTVAFYDPPQSNLYPWSNYSLILGYQTPSSYHAASASWASLVSFATSYKNFTYDRGTAKSPFVWDIIATQRASNVGGQQFFNYKHKQRLHPQVARFQFLVYAKAVERIPEQNPKRYDIRLMYVPLYTLWNPYNVALEHTISGTLNASQGSGQHKNFLGLGWRRSPPGVMAIVSKATFPNPDLVPNNQYRLFTPGNFQTLDWPNNNANAYDWQLPGNSVNKGYSQRWVDKRTFGCWFPEGTLAFKPGEAKIFSPGLIDPAYGLSGVMRLKEGYRPTNIEGVEFAGPGNLQANQSFWFLMKTDKVTQPFRDRQPGIGFSLSFGEGSSHFGANATMPSAVGENEFHNLTMLTTPSEGEAYWPPDEVDEVGYSIAELASGPWIPLFSIGFGPRMMIGTAPGTEQNRPTKGVLQSNPLASIVLSEPGSGNAKDHPANGTYDMTYHSLSLNSTITPNLSDSAGFIATGYQSGDGISRLIMAEIPLRPMASLVELQGWNPRGNNPYPPFQINLIGNSDATPLIPKNQVVPPTLSPNRVDHNLQHDDAYCANHLLFDDWFVSSIAPKPQTLGGAIAKNIDTLYRDFLNGADELSNRSYQPIAADANLTSAQVNSRIQETLNSSDGWLKVASRFEVDGMFNINSTSVEAWKAILGHARNRDQIAFHGGNGLEATPNSNGHPVTRGAAAFDVEAGRGRAIGGGGPDASEYTGFRSLTDGEIEDLAEKIVEQVRLRGPFLSLAEFVNRQLGNNEDMALAGAVQTAINRMENDRMKVLRDPAKGLSDNTMPVADPKLSGVNYQFTRAAEGSSAYGVPGWIRQADILRPIAPILSARDDTFTIRAYGDARDRSGKVIATAWCEAVVKRTRNFCDASDPADAVSPPVAVMNTKLGRRYEIVAFRWLAKDEV